MFQDMEVIGINVDIATLSKSNTHTKRGHTHMHACIHIKHTPHTAYI